MSKPKIDYDRILAVCHLLGGQYGIDKIAPEDPRIPNAILVVLEIERQFKAVILERKEEHE